MLIVLSFRKLVNTAAIMDSTQIDKAFHTGGNVDHGIRPAHFLNMNEANLANNLLVLYIQQFVFPGCTHYSKDRTLQIKVAVFILDQLKWFNVNLWPFPSSTSYCC